MKQVLQDLAKGCTYVAELPAPMVSSNTLLIRTFTTLISAGTERMLVDFGKASLLGKARKQPDKVKMVLEKVQTDGLMTTVDAVRSKLAQPLALGYCNVGVVAEAGYGVAGFQAGDRVVSNGPHADVVKVPKNLCAKIPDAVSNEAAAFTVVASIGLQGMRLADPTLGEAFVVTGVGLIGLLTVQLLRAHGCRVLAIDLDDRKLELARSFGAAVCNPRKGEDPVAAGMTFSRGQGVDGVIVTASTTSSEPVSRAARMCRKRGRIVLVGVTGLELNRAEFYEKELSFQVSCSYGPGRYDPAYEEKGRDYPFGFVRWTEQRNFEAVLDTIADGRLDVKPLVSHRFAIDEAEKAYEVVDGSEPSLGILLEYPGAQEQEAVLRDRTVQLSPLPNPPPGGRGALVAGLGDGAAVSFIGAGNYAKRALIPAFKASGARLMTVASSRGVSGMHAARKYGFARTTTDTEALFDDPESGALVIATRHDSHARLVLRGLAADKPVFVEKPLCLTLDELAKIKAALVSSTQTALPPPPGAEGGEGTKSSVETTSCVPLLMVGFNRRFAPQVRKIKDLLAGVAGPKTFVMTINAGAIPAEHWTQDPAVGGGRIIGEACHFIDLLRFLANVSIGRYAVTAMESPCADTLSISLRFGDGSLGTVQYLSNGHKSFPKERLEVFAAGRVLQLDNFRRLRGFGWPGFKSMTLWRQDKGQKACAAAFTRVLRKGGPAPIPIDEILEVSRVAIEVAGALKEDRS